MGATLAAKQICRQDGWLIFVPGFAACSGLQVESRTQAAVHVERDRVVLMDDAPGAADALQGVGPRIQKLMGRPAARGVPLMR
jgi:hypothetical protein